MGGRLPYHTSLLRTLADTGGTVIFVLDKQERVPFPLWLLLPASWVRDVVREGEELVILAPGVTRETLGVLEQLLTSGR